MSQVREVSGIVDEIKPYLGGRASEVSGAVLADLLATWLAAHFLFDDDGAVAREATDTLREDILAAHLAGARELIAVNEAEILGNLKAGRS